MKHIMFHLRFDWKIKVPKFFSCDWLNIELIKSFSQTPRINITKILFPVLLGLFLRSFCCSESWNILHHMLISFYGDILPLVPSSDWSLTKRQRQYISKTITNVLNSSNGLPLLSSIPMPTGMWPFLAKDPFLASALSYHVCI